MSPKPIVENSQPEYDHYDSLCGCAACDAEDLRRAREDPLRPARGIINALVIMLIIAACVLGVLYLAQPAHARDLKRPEPIAAPPALLKARAACPINQPLKCRAALVRAYQGVQWAKKERRHRWAPTVELAIQLACTSQPSVDCDWFRRMITCESGRDPYSQNRTSTAAGLAQFLDGTWSGNRYHRFSVYNPLANALGAAWLAARNGHAPWYASRGCWS